MAKIAFLAIGAVALLFIISIAGAVVGILKAGEEQRKEDAGHE